MNILDYIGTGKANAVTRRELCAQLALPDRTLRKLIEAERSKGAIIINDQDGGGYYQSDELRDMLAQYRANRSWAHSVLRQQKYLRRKIMDKLAERAGQMTIDGTE